MAYLFMGALGDSFDFRIAFTVAYRAAANIMAERPHRYLNVFVRSLNDS